MWRKWGNKHTTFPQFPFNQVIESPKWKQVLWTRVSVFQSLNCWLETLRRRSLFSPPTNHRALFSIVPQAFCRDWVAAARSPAHLWTCWRTSQAAASPAPWGSCWRCWRGQSRAKDKSLMPAWWASTVVCPLLCFAVCVMLIKADSPQPSNHSRL